MKVLTVFHFIGMALWMTEVTRPMVHTGVSEAKKERKRLTVEKDRGLSCPQVPEHAFCLSSLEDCRTMEDEEIEDIGVIGV